MISLTISILSILFILFIFGHYLFESHQNKKSLNSLKHPIRSITELELSYLNIYLQKFNLTFSSNHGNKVYVIEGGNMDITFNVLHKDSQLKRYTLGKKWIYFVYEMQNYIKNNNTIEAIVVKGNPPYASTNYYAIPLKINVYSLVSIAQHNLENSFENNTKIISQRPETALEYDLRQSKLYYVKEAIYLFSTLILLIFASWCIGIFYYLYLLLAIFFAYLTIKNIYITYTQHKEPQTVFTVCGKLKECTFPHIDTLVASEPVLCIGTDYYLHVPDYIIQVSPDICNASTNINNYSANITAHKLSGYTLLSTTDLPDINKLVGDNYSTSIARGFIFFTIVFVTWFFILSTSSSRPVVDNVSSMLSDFFSKSIINGLCAYYSYLLLFSYLPHVQVWVTINLTSSPIQTL